MKEKFPEEGFKQTEHFATTRWSVVLRAGGEPSAEAQAALVWLCENYWYPLYAYVRRKGHSAEEAPDLTQAFFAQLLEKNNLRVADPAKGKFRAFLLSSLSHFLANEWDKVRAQKRGGGKAPLRLDQQDAEQRYGLEPTHNLTPEKLFERRWALTVLDRVLAQLEEDLRSSGKAAHFEILKAHLMQSAEDESYAQAAEKLGMSTGAVKVAIHRLRRRYRDLLKAEIGGTVAHPNRPEEIEAEIRDLFAALQ